jgi:import inner membrane translocase subunit TIM21
MLVTFWVHGRGKDEAEPLGWIKGIWFNVEENLRWVGGYMGVSEPYQPGQTPSEVVSPVKQEAEASLGGGWFSGLAGSLRGGVVTRSGESKRGLPPPGTYKIGEVKAEYVKAGQLYSKVSWLTFRMRLASILYYLSLSTYPIQERRTPGRQ